MNNFNARLKAIEDRSAELYREISRRTDEVEKALAKECVKELGLDAFGYYVSCVGTDGTIIVFKINTCVEEFKMIFDKVMVEPSLSEYSQYTVDGEYRGVRFRSYI